MPLLPVSDLEKASPVFRGKAGNALAETLRKILSIKNLSDFYDRNIQNRGPEFAKSLIEEYHVNYDLGGAERLSELPEGPFITVSNHPYGGMDGIILVDLIGHLREDFKVMVNDFLAMIEPLCQNWIVVNPKNDASNGVTGKNVHGVREVLSRIRDGHPVGFFPSGAVSDLKLKERNIRDREWQEPLIRLVRKAKVPIIPIRFFDHNTMWFYFLGLIDWRIRTLRLPHELVNKGNKRVRVGIGEIITVEEQSAFTDDLSFRSWLREKVYGMPLPDKFEKYSDFVARTRH